MIVSNDPRYWQGIEWYTYSDYFLVGCSTMVIYDWVLIFGKEVDLIWRQRWSFVTLLYLSVRYAGIPYIIAYLLDNGCTIAYMIIIWGGLVMTVVVWAIMAILLYAMYQQSRKMLFFLVITFFGVSVPYAVTIALSNNSVKLQEVVLSGTRHCQVTEHTQYLQTEPWIIAAVWEALALCLTVWVSVKHFRELRRRRAGSGISDFLSVIIKSHIFYFAGFSIIAFFELCDVVFPNWTDSFVFWGFANIASYLQLFILGPRLVLSIREYNAEVVANSDAATAVTTMAFDERTVTSNADDDV